MGIDDIKLGGQAPHIEEASVGIDDLARLTFQTYHTPQPRMHIWLMKPDSAAPIFPWWRYQPTIDEDVSVLNESWHITSPRGFLDCLFLSYMRRFLGKDLYLILPGTIRHEGWGKLEEADRAAYLKGQGCMYRLEAGLEGRLSVNWVPFNHPQSIVPVPSSDMLWRMFQAADVEEDANSLSFFGLRDWRKLPEIVSLLINSSPDRSSALAGLVDFYGVYSSPVTDRLQPCAVVYAGSEEPLMRCAKLEEAFSLGLRQAQQDMAAHLTPRTALRILSRHAAL